jgi:hypothetical protein
VPTPWGAPDSCSQEGDTYGWRLNPDAWRCYAYARLYTLIWKTNTVVARLISHSYLICRYFSGGVTVWRPGAKIKIYNLRLPAVLLMSKVIPTKAINLRALTNDADGKCSSDMLFPTN